MIADKKGVCFGCEKRHVGCHSECEEYKEWLEDWQKQREYIGTKRREVNERRSYIRDACEKERRRRH